MLRWNVNISLEFVRGVRLKQRKIEETIISAISTFRSISGICGQLGSEISVLF